MAFASEGFTVRREAERLMEALREPGPRLLHLHGAEGTGKTSLVRGVVDRPRLHLDLPPLDEAPLLDMIESEALAVLGALPDPDRPDLLPLPGLEARWARVLEGVLSALAADGGVLVLDGFDRLAAARRRLPGELAEIWARVVRRGLPVHLILVTRHGSVPGLEPDRAIAVGALPYRVAGWMQGGRDPLDAFRRWAIFGDHAANLPSAAVHPGDRSDPDPRSLAGAVIHRVLRPSGDLHDAPLRRLRDAVQAPARYAGILMAVAERDRDWSGLTRALGAGSGSALAPYIQRLEADSRLAVRLPLDAPPDARRRRYAPVDPFDAFWFGLVLPVRNRLLREDPRVVWTDAIEPRLPDHFARWLPEAGQRWLREHAGDHLPAAARDAGAVWGAEVEFDVAGRLQNGQVCYGAVQRGGGTAGVELLDDLVLRMDRTRWGIGRQARAPLIFLQGEPDAELRRQLTRIPLAELVDPERLMGGGP